MLYEEDINEILNIDGCAVGRAPKDIFNLGILAIKSGWSPHKESKQIEHLQDRIKKLALTLNSYTGKFDRLLNIVETGLKLKIDPELKNIRDIEKQLDKVWD